MKLIRLHPATILFLLFLAAGASGSLNCAIPNDKAPTGAEEAPGFSAPYPHPADWSLWSVHGRFSVENGAPGCQECHGVDYQGGTSGVGCYDCHDYPHVHGWRRASLHGLKVINEGRESCAAVCHGVDFKGGDTGISCFDCHRFYPHPSSWGVTHKDWVEDEDEKECATVCHGTDLGGGDSGVACSDCHGPDDDLFDRKGTWK